MNLDWICFSKSSKLDNQLHWCKKHMKIQHEHKQVLLIDLQHHPQWFKAPREIDKQLRYLYYIYTDRHHRPSKPTTWLAVFFVIANTSAFFALVWCSHAKLMKQRSELSLMGCYGKQVHYNAIIVVSMMTEPKKKHMKALLKVIAFIFPKSCFW